MNPPFGSPAFLRAIELELQRQALVSLVILALLFALVMWVSYHVIRMAIRDGIKESGLVSAVRASKAGTRDPESWNAAIRAAKNPIPDMHAER